MEQEKWTITPRLWHHRLGDVIKLSLDSREYKITGIEGRHYILNGYVRASHDCQIQIDGDYAKWWKEVCKRIY